MRCKFFARVQDKKFLNIFVSTPNGICFEPHPSLSTLNRFNRMETLIQGLHASSTPPNLPAELIRILADDKIESGLGQITFLINGKPNRIHEYGLPKPERVIARQILVERAKAKEIPLEGDEEPFG